MIFSNFKINKENIEYRAVPVDTAPSKVDVIIVWGCRSEDVGAVPHHVGERDQAVARPPDQADYLLQ